MFIGFCQCILAWTTRLVCGISTFEKGVNVSKLGQSIYFANHSSHFDFLAIWSSLPRELRPGTRPVAANDYWGCGLVRQFFSLRLFNAILIDRGRAVAGVHPLKKVKEALSAGDSIILFPEGSRSVDGTVDDFKAGFYHLAVEFPEVALVPVYLDNLNRILPKGEVLVVPFLSRVIFGAPLEVDATAGKQEFLDKTKAALMELA